MEQLSIWDIKKPDIKIHERTGMIIGLGKEITLARLKGGDILEDSVVVDTMTDKLYLKQESKRKEPLKTINWPLATYTEIDWKLFKKGWIVEKEEAEFQRQKKKNYERKNNILRKLIEIYPEIERVKAKDISVEMTYKGEWRKMDDKKIMMAVEEAARLLRENPEWTYKKALEKAKEMILDEKMENLAKAN